MICDEAMQRSGQAWPVISAVLQECCLERLAAQSRSTDGMTDTQRASVVSGAMAGHGESWLPGIQS
jgi:hypothetical protein